MLTKDEARQKISKLSLRESQVLRGFCEGLDQKTTGTQLGIEVPTVKAYMRSLRVKLELDHLDQGVYDQILREIYCPLIREMEPWPPKLVQPSSGAEGAPPTTGSQPPSQSDQSKSADVPSEKAEPTVEPVGAVESVPHGRRIRGPLLLLLSGLLVGLVIGAALAIRLVGQTGGVANTPVAQITVVVTATPDPNQPTATRGIETRVVTATPPPATHTSVPIVLPTETEIPQTPTETFTPTPSLTPTQAVLRVSSTLADNRVSLKMTNAWFNHWFDVYEQFALGVSFEFKNIRAGSMLLRFQGREDFRLKDNLGQDYPCHVREIVPPEEISVPLNNEDKHSFNVACGGSTTFGLDVTQVTLYVNPISSLPASEWVIEVPR